jgi:tetratricopeptide (TPR) repeat protein
MIRPAAILVLVLACALAPRTSARAESPETLFHAACAAYQAGDFQDAYDDWLAIVENHGLAADLCYNLGNAAQRLARPGEAALWYRRALVLEPGHAESRQNLRVIERETGYLKLEWNFLQRLADRLSRRELTVLAATGAWAIALSLAFRFALGRSLFKGPALAIRIAGVVLLAFSLGAILLRRDEKFLLARSIVTASDAVALTSPAEDSKDVISLPPGTEVDVVAQRAAWTYVAIPGDLRGWVQSAELAPLWPFDVSFLD